ncbi:phenoloxidase 1 isoform X2 [Ooceraea biroi]|uniref:Phenoloxidase subunit A3 n=1 Tax=Ooceraea biroi TaxID=2015173 RepID=A0A026WIF2_OOCBI|nr:phenoloxidase 1 isoform X2 [Ooceraea biroi]EZA55827.1 Phenoloxidase subunit A3 [Ooceraea biroi]
MSNRMDILHLFDRTMEPMYMPKGRERVTFDVPLNYLSENVEGFKSITTGGTSKVPIKEMSLPDIRIPLQLGRQEPFSLFIPKHREMATSLIDTFLDMETFDDFLSTSIYCRDQVNPQMFVYAFSVAMLHRPDTRDIPIPPLTEILPEKYFDKRTLSRAKKMANLMPETSRPPVEIPREFTASDLDEEHRVAYWREDIGINLHHWHWHLVYPFEGNINIVNKDRRGELFYYMHHQVQARYNCERLCNRLPRVKRFHNWREPIQEGYFPKLDSLVADHVWPARPAGAVIKDVHRPEIYLSYDVQDLERWRDRIYEIIHTGTYIDSRGERVPLTEFEGINVLGNIMESSILSPNRSVYGDLHNLVHMAISYCHDPDHRYLENFGIMGEPATAMRDPIFYRFHGFTDRVFLEYKNTLPEYSLQQLSFAGVEITDIWVQTPDQSANVLTTFWKQSDIDLSRGLDFIPRGSLPVRFTHLFHTNFTYSIVAINRNAPRRGTVRIFIAPKRNERGMLYEFIEQKELMIEMDKFTVLLGPGRNTIERKSTDSSVTIPFEKTFRSLDENRSNDNEEFNFCGCGWPQHMLVPKGTEEGFPMELFIMISDYTGDEVQQEEPTRCRDAVSYCGLRDRKYPDARPMGYPFDRRPRAGVDTLAQFLTSNMAVTDITVRHTDI